MFLRHNSLTTATTYEFSGEYDGRDASTILGSGRVRTLAPYAAEGSSIGKANSQLQELALAFTLTGPVSYFQPPWDLFRTSVYPSVVSRAVQGKKRISLRVARRMALGVLADTEGRLWRERADEAGFLASFWSYDS